MRDLHAARVITIIALAALTLPAARPAQAAQTASVADLTLPAVAYSHADQTASGTLTLTATNDLADGWNVTLSSSAFAYSGLYNGAAIPAGNLSIITANAPTVSSGQPIDPSAGPKVPATGASGSLDVPRKVLQAEAGYGSGTYAQALDVQLTVPAGSRAGSYVANLTVTIAVGP